MFDISSFFQVFWVVMLLVLSAGPGMISTMNISTKYGYRHGIMAMLGCFTVDIFYITIGVFAVQEFVKMLPDKAVSYFSGITGICLLYLAYKLWKINVFNIKMIKTNNKDILMFAKMVKLTLSSPIAIIGYFAIFSTIADVNSSGISNLLGGYCGAFVGHMIIVLLLSTVGIKIRTNIFFVINKILAIIIAIFACTLLFHFMALIYMHINDYYLHN